MSHHEGADVSEPFDKAELMERVDNDVEFLEETIAMLDEDSPAFLDRIRTAATTSDASALATSAHALKSMVANFCAAPAEAAALSLERMGREERLGDVDDAVARLEHETQRLRTSLNEFLQAMMK